MANKILIIEDSNEIIELLKAVLTLKDFVVLVAPTGKKGLSLINKKYPDLVILDLILPDMDGLEICKAVRKNIKTKNVPILVLTARTEVLDRVKGLEMGADDYLIKPFDPLELVARVKALLRRHGTISDENQSLLKMGHFEIDPSTYTVYKQSKPIKHITSREFDILYTLMRNSPKPVSRENLFQIVWGKSEKNYTRLIDIHIANIRKKIGSDQIKTIHGKGYLFSPT